VVLEGEIVAMMDHGETVMRPGDVLVQRATNHSWSNRSKHNCRMLFVLLALQEGEEL
jgi:Cupin domain.